MSTFSCAMGIRPCHEKHRQITWSGLCRVVLVGVLLLNTLCRDVDATSTSNKTTNELTATNAALSKTSTTIIGFTIGFVGAAIVCTFIALAKHLKHRKACRIKAESMPHYQKAVNAEVGQAPHTIPAHQEPVTACIVESWRLGEGIDNPALENDNVEKFLVAET